MRWGRSKSKQGWLVLLEADAWQLAGPSEPGPRVTFPPERLTDQVPLIREALRGAGWRHENLVIGLSAELCLAATVQVPTPQMLRKRQAMRYHLESWIPWSAEEFVADYVPHKTEALMMAVPIEPLRSFLNALEEHDGTASVMTPSAFLAFERHLVGGNALSTHVLIWRHEAAIELLVVREGRAYAWTHSDSDVASLAAVAQLELSSDVPWLARGFQSAELMELEGRGIEVVQAEELQWMPVLQEGANAVAAGDAEPIVNLRRDELCAKRAATAMAPQLAAFKLACVAASLAICATLWIWGDRFQQGEIAAQQSLVGIYEKTFPKNPVPDRIVQAMRREAAALKGTRGVAGELPAGPSGDVVLDLALAALPPDLRFRVPEVRVDGTSVYLTGEVRANADADRIATLLREAGFEVEPPKTQRLSEQGFAVHWTAQLPAAAPIEKKR